MEVLHFILAGMVVLLYAPIFLKFYKNWSRRRNPVSLAVCAIVTLLMWAAVSGAWEVSENLDREIVVLVSAGISMAVALYTHLTFYLAEKKFDDKRED